MCVWRDILPRTQGLKNNARKEASAVRERLSLLMDQVHVKQEGIKLESAQAMQGLGVRLHVPCAPRACVCARVCVRTYNPRGVHSVTRMMMGAGRGIECVCRGFVAPGGCR